VSYVPGLLSRTFVLGASTWFLSASSWCPDLVT